MARSVIQVIGNSVIGGAERHLLDLAGGLVERGWGVGVVCPRPGPLTEMFSSHGMPVRCIEMVQPRPGDEYALDWSAVQRLADHLREWAPDVVHCHLYPAYLHASLAAREAGISAIVQTAHTLVVRPGDVLLGRLGATHTIAVSHVVAQRFEQAGVPSERIEVIYNGVDAAHFDLDRTDPGAPQRLRAALGLAAGPVIGTVCRLSPEKGVDVLLHAVHRLRQTAPRLWPLTTLIAGDGSQAAELRQLTEDLGLSESVRFLGARHDIPAVNRLLDVFVLPSREEACPMALLEAMAAARAAVATGVGGTPEVLTHAHDGWLVPPDDPDALARAMLALLEDPIRRQVLGTQARQTCAARFTCARMIDQTVACYEWLLDTPER